MYEEKTITRVLVVEDNSEYLNNAVEVLGAIEGLEVVTATSVDMAKTFIHNGQVDGVISDVFIPYCEGAPADKPLGLQLAAYAAGKGLRCVLCTDQYHHSEDFEWINSLFNELREPLGLAWGRQIIDVDPHYNKGPKKKKWMAAYKELVGKKVECLEF